MKIMTARFFPLAIAVGTLLCGSVRANDSAMLNLYADTILDGLDGRTWVVTDGTVDHIIQARANRRGLDLVFVPIMQTPGESTIYQEFEKAATALGNPKLEVAATFGAIPFALTWLRESPDDATAKLAFVHNPGIARFAGFATIPNGVVFGVHTATNVTDAVLASAAEKYVAVRDVIGETIATTEDSGTSSFAQKLRALAGVAGNNLGVALYRAGQRERAADMLLLARTIDRDNVSALLNIASIVREGVRPELGARLADDLTALAQSRRQNWDLALNDGFVINPKDYMAAKWYWTISGLSAADGEQVAEVVGMVDEEARAAVSERLRVSFAMQLGGTQFFLAFLQNLPDGPLSGETMLAVAQLLSVHNTHARALRWVERAKAQPDTDAVQAAFVEADILQKLRRPDDALAVIAALKSKDAGTAERASHKLIELYAGANRLKELAAEANELAAKPGAQEWIKTAAQGWDAYAANDFAKAQALLSKAVEQNPETPLPYYSLLMLDMMTQNQKAAETHARNMLTFNPRHGFANYILATIAVERKEYQRAEQHFGISLADNPSWFVFNDFAAMLIELKNFAPAEMLARNAIAVGGEPVAAVWDTLASAVRGLGREDEALELYEKAATLEGGDDPRIHLNLAELYLAKNNAAKADAAIKAVDKKKDDLGIKDRERLGDARRKLNVLKKK